MKSRPYTPNDVRRMTGLSYRQLRFWDKAGALKNARASNTGWRTFSYIELLTIMLCVELKNQFGIPLELLGSIKPSGLENQIIGKDKITSDCLVSIYFPDARDGCITFNITPLLIRLERYLRFDE